MVIHIEPRYFWVYRGFWSPTALTSRFESGIDCGYEIYWGGYSNFKNDLFMPPTNERYSQVLFAPIYIKLFSLLISAIIIGPQKCGKIASFSGEECSNRSHSMRFPHMMPIAHLTNHKLWVNSKPVLNLPSPSFNDIRIWKKARCGLTEKRSKKKLQILCDDHNSQVIFTALLMNSVNELGWPSLQFYLYALVRFGL